MRNRMFQAVFVAFAFLAVVSGGPLMAEDQVRITGIGFRGTGDPSQIEINADHPIQVVKKANTEDKQIVLEIAGATLDKAASRPIDTSSFNGKVALISPYQIEGTGGVRIVVQLRENVEVNLETQGNSAVLSVPVQGGQGERIAASDSDPEPTTGASQAEAKSEPKSEMEQVLEASKSKKFTGRPVTLQVRDVDVQDIFSMISEASGFNIVVTDSVKGKLTLSLVDVPWDQALDVVLQTLHLAADRHGSILRIMTMQEMVNQRSLELAAKSYSEAVTPRVTRVISINYAKLDALKTSLLQLALAEDATRVGASSATVSGNTGGVSKGTEPPLVVVADERTNSLIVRGLPEYVDRAKKLIQILDTQTPQVVIEGKIVEATENFSRSIGGSLGVVQTDGGAYGFSTMGGNPYDSLFGSGGTQSSIFNVAGASSTGLSMGYTKLIGGNRLNFTLNLAETEGKIKVVSSPRAVVLDKQNAQILQSFPAISEVVTTSTTGDTKTYQQVEGNLSLNVTPTVTSDGSVMMALTLTRDVVNQLSNLTAATVAHRNITTNVIVDSGNTLVMGGFYNTDTRDTENGVPFLRNLPIIGWLFGNKSSQSQRSELLFFITPKIINPKKAGFTDVGST